MSALLGETYVSDAMPKEKSLAEHDKEKHPHGFNPETDTCKFRERLSKETESDKADIENPNSAPKESIATEKPLKKPIVTPEEDAAYIEAVEKGDMETAAKMVMEVAARAFPETIVVDEKGNPKIFYHGTSSDIKKFIVPSRGSIFFAPTEEGARDGAIAGANERYGEQPRPEDSKVNKFHIIPVFLNCRSIHNVSPDKEAREFYDNLPDFVQTESEMEELRQQEVMLPKEEQDAYHEALSIAYGAGWNENDGTYKKQPLPTISQRRFQSVPDWSAWGGYYKGHDLGPDQYSKAIAIDNGHDSFMVRDEGGKSIALWDPSKIKSADPVTYDDDGKVVPLSRRFDDGDDIRGDVSGKQENGKEEAKVQPPKPMGISHIFTGSAANYDKPSLLAIGTGEGNQVYGWGLYGSNKKEVAEGYAKLARQKTLERKIDEAYLTFSAVITKQGRQPKDTVEIDASKALEHWGSLSKAMKMIQMDIDDGIRVDKNKKILQELKDHGHEYDMPHEWIYEQTFFTNRPEGDESHLLSWYDPISEDNKKRAIEAIVNPFLEKLKGSGKYNEEKRQKLIDAWQQQIGERTGEELYRFMVSHFGTPKDASIALANSGIDGIKYPVDSYKKPIKDGNEVGWDYVSFRNDNIRIDKKYVDGQKMFDYQELMNKHHSDIDPMAILAYLTRLDSPEEMAAEFARIMESGKIEKDKTAQDELYEALVEDADTLKDQTLQEHDRRHHPGGYHEGDTCKFRNKLKTETETDKADELSKENSSRKNLAKIANKLKSFIKGVSIRFSDKPHEMDSSNTRKSIRQSEQDNWNRILDAFEHKTAGADATRHHTLLEHTPAVLRRLGVPDRPITIMGGTIHKMIGNIRNSLYEYHEIPISELRNLLLDLDNPVAVFDSKSDPNAIVILTNLLDKHGNAKSVVPLKLDREASGTARENTIASAYGQKPDNLQQWIDEGYLRYVSKKGLKKSAQRLQLPRDSILKTHGVLMEEDFSAEQLGEIIPDMPSGVKGGDEKKGESGEVISFRDNNGEVVGTYNRNTNEVVLYEGADADTIGHELCGHATWQYAEQMARNGNDSLLKKMNEVVDSPTAKPVWDEVKANYEGEDKEVQREEVWAHIIGHKTSKAIEEINKSRGGRRWYQRFWGVVKEAWRGLVSAAGLNNVDTSGIDQMSTDEFSDFMVKQMTSGKTLGSISKGEKREDGGERKSIVKKPIVSAAEDAAYMEAVKKGDMETAAKMVREVAGRAFPNTKVVADDGLPKIVFHNTDSSWTVPAVPWEGPIEWDGLPGLFFADREQPQYGKNKISCFVNLMNPLDMNDGGRKALHGRSSDRIDEFTKQYEDAIKTGENEFEFGDDGVLKITPKGMSLLKYDGYFGEHPEDEMGKVIEYAVMSARQVKSADPVTYDDNGNVIPLSRRFDSGDDIRGDVSGASSFIDMMKRLHPDVNPDELLSKLKSLGSREEMERAVAQILGAKST